MIQLQNVHKTFGKGDAAVRALRGVDLHIAKGEMLAIMGKSGSGKSTLLNVLGGFLACDSGAYLYNEAPLNLADASSMLSFRRREVGIVLQNFALIEDINVHENVALPLRYQRLSRKEIHARVQSVLLLLSIADKEKAFPGQLSGGQQQRVAIARALIKEPQILLADEPTGALDTETEQTVLELFSQIHAMGKTVVMVTHDESVASICQRVIVLSNGQVVAG